jgi:hypothetical protein
MKEKIKKVKNENTNQSKNKFKAFKTAKSVK